MKFLISAVTVCFKVVLPLTREWIEIELNELAEPLAERSPAYEGVECNNSKKRYTKPQCGVLPLTREWIEIRQQDPMRQGNCTVLPLTREWIEISFTAATLFCAWFSLLRGSGLKLTVKRFHNTSCSSPSYEGVD